LGVPVYKRKLAVSYSYVTDFLRNSLSQTTNALKVGCRAISVSEGFDVATRQMSHFTVDLRRRPYITAVGQSDKLHSTWQIQKRRTG